MSGKEVMLPEEEGQLLDELMERDAAWFKAHPTARAFLRPSAPGDFVGTPEGTEPELVGTTHMYVRYLGPGLRARRFIELPEGFSGRFLTEDEFWEEDGVVYVVVPA